MGLLNYYAGQPNRNSDVPATIRSYSEDRIRDFVLQRTYEAKEGKAYKHLKDNYDEYRRAYNGIFKRNKNIPKWRNRLYVRLSFKIVETLRAYFEDAFFGRSPFITVQPNYSMWKDASKNMEAVLQYEALLMKKRRKFFNVFNYALKYGCAVTRSFWNFQRGVRPVRQFRRDENGFIQHFDEVEKPYVKVDSPDFKVLDPVRVAFDPLNYLPSEMRYAVEDIETDFDTLYNNRKFYQYINLDKLEDDLKGGGVSTPKLTDFGTNPFLGSDYYGTLREEQDGTSDYTRKRVTITRYEGRLDMPGNQNDPRFYEVYVANDRHIIKLNRNPYSFDSLSYNIYGIMPQDDSYIGIGAIEPILTDQKVLNILMNVRLDSMHLLLSPRILAHKNSFERGVNNISNVSPGGIIGVKELADLSKVVQPMNMPDQGFNTFHQFWQMQNQHAEDTLAMSPNARGMLAQQKRSATEVVRSLEAANARFLHMVSYFDETGYSDQVKKDSSMIQQFMTSEKQIRITGDPQAGEIYKNLMPWDIQGDFMFHREDPTKANKEQEAQLWANLLQVFAPYFQLLAEKGVTPVPFLRGVLEASPVFNKMDLSKVLPPDTDPQAKQVLNSEDSRLEKAIGGGPGSMPGSGLPPGQPITQPQPAATAAGIASRI